MSNTIKYLDQRGLKTFHNATGWVDIELGTNQPITHYTHSPVKFPDGGTVFINGNKETVAPHQEMMLYKGTTIMSETPMTISVFVNEYNQLIQHEFKTNRIETNSKNFILDGSSLIFKNVDDGETRFGVYTRTEPVTDTEKLLGINTNDKYLQVSNTTNTTTITPTKITSSNLEIRGTTNLVGDATISGSLSLPGSDEQVILGDGSPKKLEELIVGNATKATNAENAENATKATNADKVQVSQLIGTPHPKDELYLLGSKNDSGYNELFKINGVRFDQSTDNFVTIIKQLFIQDCELWVTRGDDNEPSGLIYGNLIGNAATATEADSVKVVDSGDANDNNLLLWGSTGVSGGYNTVIRRPNVYVKQNARGADVLVAPKMRLSQPFGAITNTYSDDEVVPWKWIKNYIENTMTYDGNLEKDIFTQTT